ncbi:MAG TPA: hypothetical protein DDX47_03815 [Candidatus Jacksonbacteria bacterium]|nr:hypothetical protein [Candidatus Jacksonbacteria bacterium]HCC50337.1 hypothetical protein [Candidatus Jacksonbacteria bacterium]HCE49645.1 hypothetical protein [Candidatus Jacksonbacteria bacterium]HCR15691.1 hypothetical protein [Candidatus Jacksonbacteria bacterium]
MINIDPQKIKGILLSEAYVTAEDWAKAEDFASKHRTAVLDYLLNEGVLTKDLLGQAIAEACKIPYADLNSNQPPAVQVLKIPATIGKKYRAVLFAEEKDKVTVTTDNPAQPDLIGELKKIFPKKKITIAYSLSEDIEESFIHYRKPLETRFTQILRGQEHIAPEIIEEIMSDALVYRASDIHFEPQEEEVIIRFRIDGVLYEAGRVPKQYYENILNRVKVQSQVRLDEHFSAQDGAIRYVKKDGVVLDLRVSIVPTLDGEKVAMRLLSLYVRDFSLSNLGLSTANQDILLQAGKKPFGMILVTGPTGSGKTTTLYALLKILHQPEVNITTIEDPVEYKIAGVNQIQVNPQTNLTFAKGLRSIVRQDPDVILVGEIRDEETAEIAVNAALTGHLLLSTFHANDAATAIPRLLDMAVEPFLLASTLELIIAQRLVRRICDNCRFSQVYTLEDLRKILPNPQNYFPKCSSVTLYHGKGCKMCSNFGYKGRVAIYEFIPSSRELQDLVLRHPSSKQIWDLVRKQGARPLFEDGIEKVKDGLTTIEEVLRVASPSIY